MVNGYHIACMYAQLCLTLCDPMDCSLPGSSVHGIIPARILEWVAISSSKRIFPTQGSNPHLLYQQTDSLPWSHLASPSYHIRQCKIEYSHYLESFIAKCCDFWAEQQNMVFKESLDCGVENRLQEWKQGSKLGSYFNLSNKMLLTQCKMVA